MNVFDAQWTYEYQRDHWNATVRNQPFAEDRYRPMVVPQMAGQLIGSALEEIEALVGSSENEDEIVGPRNVRTSHGNVAGDDAFFDNLDGIGEEGP